MSPTISPPLGLLAVDLDGTLVRSDGGILAADRAAIARAGRAGVAVTIATSRLAPATIDAARSLALEAPLVSAGGAVLVCPRTGALLESTPIPPATLGTLLDLLRGRGLAPFVCLADTVLTDVSGRALAGWVTGWSRGVVILDQLGDAARGGVIVMTLALGEEDTVMAALRPIEDVLGNAVRLDAFSLGNDGPWALRAQPAGIDKGAALSRLAARLGVPRARVGAIGDSLDDLPMLAWAGTSFAMGQAPASVRHAATRVLRATAETGGGVAEAVEQWLLGPLCEAAVAGPGPRLLRCGAGRATTPAPPRGRKP